MPLVHPPQAACFPTDAAAAPYASTPEALGNHVYADRLGNGNEASGDGFRFRGRGLMQITARTNDRRVGFESNPDALSDPLNTANTAAAFWQDNGLNGRPMSRPMRGLALAAGLLAAHVPVNQDTASAQPKSAPTLCQASDVVLFACRVGAKRVSICGQGHGKAVYRFGRPGRVELQIANVYFAERSFSGGGETQVYADTPTHRYIVYDRIVRTSFDDGRHDPQAESGLVVQRGKRTISRRRCVAPTTFDQRARTMVAAGVYAPHE